MRFIILVLICAFFPLGVNATPKYVTTDGLNATVHAPLPTPTNYSDYKPIDPIYLESVRVYENGAMVEKNWATITDKAIKRSLLPIQTSYVSIKKTDDSAKASFTTGSLAKTRGNYTVIMDFMKYRVEPLYNVDKRFLGNGKVGVGLRIKLDVTTKKDNLNLASLIGIGLEASRGSLNGNISIDVIGIDSADVTNLIPLTAEIDQTAIQASLQALASIKTKIYDDNVTITPHLMAISDVIKDSEQLNLNSNINGNAKP